MRVNGFKTKLGGRAAPAGYAVGMGIALQLSCTVAFAANADPVAPSLLPDATPGTVGAPHAGPVPSKHYRKRRVVVRPSEGVIGAPPRAGSPGLASPGPKVIDPAYAAIDRLRLRYIVNQPTVTQTVFGDFYGAREKLADYGIGFSGLLTGSFEHNVLHEPTSTFGSQHYIGQKTEFDTSASYLAMTYDMSHVGLTDGLATVQACAGGGTYHIYPRGVRLCALYLDQPFFNKTWDIQVGILANNNLYANPLVGGSVATGSIGPSANILTELGLSVGGEGAPGVNITYQGFGDFYDRAGVQRSTSPKGYVYEGEIANPAGLTFNEPLAGALAINEVGYRHFATENSKYTWVRVGGIANSSQFTNWLMPTRTQGAAGMYALYDQQLMQFDPSDPRRGIYAGVSFMYADPAVFTYSDYYEFRAYINGPFASRPLDQITFVANHTVASGQYLTSIAKKYPNELYSSVNNITLIYGYRVTNGVFLNVGVNYGYQPTITYTKAQGNPLLFRASLAAYL